MNAGWTLLPLILVRFLLLGFLDSSAIRRAAHFPPLIGKEKAVYAVYQVSTTLFFIVPFFLKIRTDSFIFLIGLLVYGLGTLILTLSVIGFTAPTERGLNRSGIYRRSRNPMYVGYFVYFLGCALLMRSFALLGILLVFQFAAHWIILAEERWCTEQFGEEYRVYRNQVRRYF